MAFLNSEAASGITASTSGRHRPHHVVAHRVVRAGEMLAKMIMGRAETVGAPIATSTTTRTTSRSTSTLFRVEASADEAPLYTTTSATTSTR